jgi:hypothetical protein
VTRWSLHAGRLETPWRAFGPRRFGARLDHELRGRVRSFYFLMFIFYFLFTSVRIGAGERARRRISPTWGSSVVHLSSQSLQSQSPIVETAVNGWSLHAGRLRLPPKASIQPNQRTGRWAENWIDRFALTEQNEK